jgi:hypothetical protein
VPQILLDEIDAARKLTKILDMGVAHAVKPGLELWMTVAMAGFAKNQAPRAIRSFSDDISDLIEKSS